MSAFGDMDSNEYQKWLDDLLATDEIRRVSEANVESGVRTKDHEQLVVETMGNVTELFRVYTDLSFPLKLLVGIVAMWTQRAHEVEPCPPDGPCPQLLRLTSELAYQFSSALGHGFINIGEAAAVAAAAVTAIATMQDSIGPWPEEMPQDICEHLKEMFPDDEELWEQTKGSITGLLAAEMMEEMFVLTPDAELPPGHPDA